MAMLLEDLNLLLDRIFRVVTFLVSIVDFVLAITVIVRVRIL